MNDIVGELSYLEKIVDFEGGVDRGSIAEKEILIYSPGKTGTVSLYHSIGTYCANAFSWDGYQKKLLHNHKNAALLTTIKIVSPDITHSFLEKRQIIKDLIEYKRRLGQQLIIVSSFREPVSRAISNVFQQVDKQVFVDGSKDIEDFDFNECEKMFWHLSGFENFRHPIEEFDPGFFDREKFDKEKKCLLVERGHYKILVVCLEHSDKWGEILESELGFSGIDIQTHNKAKTKGVSQHYSEFKRNLSIPKSLIKRIYYKSSYVNYLNWFYTKEEVDQFYKTSLSSYGQGGSSLLPFLRNKLVQLGPIRFIYGKKRGLIRGVIMVLHNTPRIRSALLRIFQYTPNLAGKVIDYARRLSREDHNRVAQTAFDREKNYRPEVARIPELDELILNRINAMRVNPPESPRSGCYVATNEGDIVDSLDSRRECLKNGRPILAYVSPIPPVPSGVSYYSQEVLPALSKHYEIVVIVHQDDVTDNDFTVRDLDWFKDNYTAFGRVMYHIGNSEWHSHIVSLLDSYPGVVVLHDVYLGHMFNEMDAGLFDRQLYLSHGYSGLRHKQDHGLDSAIWKFPHCCSLIRSSYGVVVHSDYAKEQLQMYCGSVGEAQVATTPLANSLPSVGLSSEARARLGLPENKFIVCCFGGLGPTKLNDRLLQAWSTLSSAEKDGALLLFVGVLNETFNIKVLAPILKGMKVSSSVSFTDYVTVSQYRDYLLAADIAVQLRTQSRGESSRSVLECMAYGLPTIVNDHGSNRELPANCLIKIPEDFANSVLQEQLSACISGDKNIDSIGDDARQYISESRTPEVIAGSYHNHIESMYKKTADKQIGKLMEVVKLCEDGKIADCDLPQWAGKLAASFVDNSKTIYTDISEIVMRDRECGIQRVAKNVIDHGLGVLDKKSVRLEPIYMHRKRFYLARRYMFNRYNVNWQMTPDMPVRFSKGDIFIGLDFTIDQHPYLVEVLSEIKKQGVKVNILLYDLLPILSPSTFYKSLVSNFQLWLEAAVTVADGMICISKSVADELLEWLAENPPKRPTTLNVGYFHLGSDLQEYLLSPPPKHTNPIHGVETKERQTVLMVGTVEPRKGYAQAFHAFDLLWKKGFDVNLVIVGREGWMVDDIVENMKRHPEYNKRFYWLENADDSVLEKLYRESTVLLAASKGEGFGLPIVEAAGRGTPVIVRDIPVFREVAGEGGFYFKGESPEHLAEKVLEWFSLFALEKTPKPQLVKTVTWQESSRQLYDVLLHDNWYEKWGDL